MCLLSSIAIDQMQGSNLFLDTLTGATGAVDVEDESEDEDYPELFSDEDDYTSSGLDLSRELSSSRNMYGAAPPASAMGGASPSVARRVACGRAMMPGGVMLGGAGSSWRPGHRISEEMGHHQ